MKPLVSRSKASRHHSLVTPIDWKPAAPAVPRASGAAPSPLVGDTY